MTKQEFNKIAMAIRTYHPKERILLDDYAMELWYDALKDLPYKSAYRAIRKWAETNRWSPSISDIRGMCAVIENGEIRPWEDGWQEVVAAIRNYGYMREEEALGEMSEPTRKVVQRLGFQSLCASENPAVDRANFRDIYNNMTAKQREREQMSAPVRNAIDAATIRRYAIPEDAPAAIERKEPEEDDSGLSENVRAKLQELREQFGRGTG